MLPKHNYPAIYLSHVNWSRYIYYALTEITDSYSLLVGDLYIAASKLIQLEVQIDGCMG